MGLGGSLASTSSACPLYHRVEVFVSGIDSSLQSAYGRALGFGDGPPRRLDQVWRTLAQRTGVDQNGLAALIGWHSERLLQRLQVYEDTLTTLAALNGSCHLGVITNAWLHMELLLEVLGIRQYFQSVIVSAQVGLSKPDPAIYALSLRSLGVPAAEAVFVDDLPANVLAARKVGLTGLWLVRKPERHKSVPRAFLGLPRISSLEEVIPLIKGA
jgi:FMN phosphatase YigB (HAD superfamily)